jgi:hypothetical protein
MTDRMESEAVARINVYAVITRAVEEGVVHGLNRSYKHTDSPTNDQITQNIYEAVMSELSEVMYFDDFYKEE